jgi:hypothetical protein
VQAGNIRCDGIRRAHVFNDIIRNGKALFARRLGGKNMFCMFTTDPIAKHRTRDLRLFWNINDQHAIGIRGQPVFYQ